MEILKTLDNKTQITLWADYFFLCENFSKSQIVIKDIHIVLFKKDQEVYVKNDNYKSIFTNSSDLPSIINEIEKEYDDCTINKLHFSYKDLDILYDDDALLIITKHIK